MPNDTHRYNLGRSELRRSRNIPGIEKYELGEYYQHSQELEQREKGNWEMPLPFKKDYVTLPNNLEQCIKGLLAIKWELLNYKNGKTLKYDVL